MRNCRQLLDFCIYLHKSYRVQQGKVCHLHSWVIHKMCLIKLELISAMISFQTNPYQEILTYFDFFAKLKVIECLTFYLYCLIIWVCFIRNLSLLLPFAQPLWGSRCSYLHKIIVRIIIQNNFENKKQIE